MRQKHPGLFITRRLCSISLFYTPPAENSSIHSLTHPFVIILVEHAPTCEDGRIDVGPASRSLRVGHVSSNRYLASRIGTSTTVKAARGVADFTGCKWALSSRLSESGQSCGGACRGLWWGCPTLCLDIGEFGKAVVVKRWRGAGRLRR